VLRRARRERVGPKMARRPSSFETTFPHGALLHCEEDFNIWSAYEWRAVLHQLFAERRAPDPPRYWKEKGHRTSGGLSYSRHTENYRALFAKDAPHNPIVGSHSRALIQIKMHSPDDGCLNSKAVGEPPSPDGFAFVPLRAVWTASVGFVEPPSEQCAAGVHLVRALGRSGPTEEE
jgi:hypothetical protein